jgi:hypothetical protein
MSAAAGGGALCFFLCSIQMTMGASSIQMKNNYHYSFFLNFFKITIYSLISLFSVHSVC